ncbi:hypothetical protein DFH09DRAFT_1328897 [Mycena vulgaris]|nr:hypothetical protein DFH09DRAFT_1328897 [Mycena vulgaris]
MNTEPGTLSFRSSRVVDAGVGFETADAGVDMTADRGVYISNDGLRRVDELLNIGHKKARLRPQKLDDVFADWVPVDDTDMFLDAEILANLDKVSGTEKRKRYESSEWKGEFWKPEALEDLGLVYQLGHGGKPCLTPSPRIYSMVVIDTSGIHTVKYHYCKCVRSRRADSDNNLTQLLRNGWYPASITDPSTCATFDVLDLFRLLAVVGNVNAHDFVRTLERRTDALTSTGIRWMPDRYRVFARMARQYAFLMRVCRAGRAHDEVGVDATKLGELMILCWVACMTGGIFLPTGAMSILSTALDANFKLKNRLRANERYDPSLGPGWAVFVEPTEYRDHLKNYVGENDISTCIVFAALLQKDTRQTTGLRTSGVGGCVCARHESVRPNGIGDLQKGEQYANMDYIVMSCLAGFALMMLTISYDIACQWKKIYRNGIRSSRSAYNSTSTTFSNENSLSFLVGVGKTDGEGIERTWADFNPAAYHTKEMGLGNRADTLEDKIDSHNFLKNLTLGDALRRKLLVAIAERARQVEAFKEVNKFCASQ